MTAAAIEGDPAAVELVAEGGACLDQDIADLAAILDPSMVVVGGGVSEIGELLLGPARERLAAVLPGRGFRPELVIRAAELGTVSGLVGAADLAHRAVAVDQPA